MVTWLGTCRDRVDSGLDVFPRRTVGNQFRIERRLLTQVREVGSGYLVSCTNRIDQGRGPLVELGRVCGFAAKTGDDENVGLLSRGRSR